MYIADPVARIQEVAPGIGSDAALRRQLIDADVGLLTVVEALTFRVLGHVVLDGTTPAHLEVTSQGISIPGSGCEVFSSPHLRTGEFKTEVSARQQG